jgi:hypothetical protein
MKINTSHVGIVTLVLASACGASEQSSGGWSDVDGAEGATASEDEVEGDAVEGSLQTLHQFEVQGTTYAYLRDGDDVLLHVSSSRTAPRIHVETEAGAEPTFLEIFNALQPGVEPHEALLAAHRESALSQGRGSDAALPSTLSSVIEKTAADLEDCKLYFLGVWGGGFGGGTPVVSSKEGKTTGTTLQASTASVAQKFMAAGACNFAGTISHSVAFDKRINAAGAWVTQLTASIPLDGVNYIVHNPSAQIVNLRDRMLDASNNGVQLVAARRQ